MTTHAIHPRPAEPCAPKPTGQTAEQLMRAAHTVFGSCGISMPPNKVARLVRAYRHDPERNRWDFFEYLAAAVRLTADRRRAAMQHPDVVRVIAYADPTGETAVTNVMEGNRR